MKRLFSSRLTGPLLVIIFILFANGLYLLHLTNPNPVNTQSGLATSSSRFIKGEDTIDPNDGTTTQALGHLAANDLLHGHMPWWNYNEQVGAPLMGDMQSASLFPLTLILELSNGLLYFHIILELIAGLATYFLLKKLGLRRFSAVTFGIVFGLNGAFAWFGSPNFNPIAFLPLLVLGIEIVYDSAIHQKKRGWILITCALALSLYAGFPEEAYLDGLLAGLWFLARLIQIRHTYWRQFLLKSVTGAIVGLLLAAPLLIAFLSYINHAFIGDHAGLADTYLPYLSLPMLVFPYIYGQVYNFPNYDPTGRLGIIWGNVGGYITLSLIFFAAMSLFDKSRRLLKYILLAWVLLLASRIYGLPVFDHVLNLIPGMSKVAVYRYSEPALEFAGIMLAAFGFDKLIRSKIVAKRPVAIVCVSLLVISFVLVLVAMKQENLIKLAPHHHLIFLAVLVWSLGGLALIALSLLGPFRYRRFICSAVVIADAMVMFMVPQFSAPRTIIIDTTPVSFLQSHLGNYRFFSLGPIQPNYGSYYNIASIDTNNLPLAKRWTNFMTKSLDPAVNPASFDGADAPSSGSLSPKDIFLSRIKSYEYVGVKYLATFPDTLTASEVTKANLKSVFNSPVSSIYQLPNPEPYFSINSSSCQITKIYNKASLSVDCKKPASLVRREIYSSGWKAKTGNTNLAIKQSGPLFQSVELPAGVHTINFNYLPPHIYIGLILFITGLVFTIFIYLKSPLQNYILKQIESSPNFKK
jgi:hypothetical protein